MPPHDPELGIPLTVDTNYTTGPWRYYITNGPLEHNDYTVNTNTTTSNLYQDWMTDAVKASITESTLDVEYLDKKVRIALDKVLDQYFRKLYEIINDVHNFSISEDEFMKLLKED